MVRVCELPRQTEESCRWYTRGSRRSRTEALLALGDASFLNETEHEVPTFRVYAERWLKTYADVQCKQSTRRSYEQLLRLHVMPRFGSKLPTDIRRDEVKRFVAELSQATRQVNSASILKFSRKPCG